MKHIFLSFSIIVLFFTGCSGPTIDTTTDESMRASIEEVRNSLDSDEQVEFDDALKIIMFSNINTGGMLVAAFTGDVPNKESMVGNLKKSLEGKSASEIISDAQEIKEGIE